jgi:hypothetical protein
MSNMKDGKIALSDREKYRQMATQTGSILTIPDVLRKAFEEAGLAAKWVSKVKIASNGGYHPSNWIPYEMSAAQKAELPKVYLGNIVSSHLERGDLILAVKPKELVEEHKREVRRKTQQQMDAYYQETDAEGKTILTKPE